MTSQRVTLGLLAVITLMALGLRLYGLADVPAGLYCDEAANGYNGYRLFHDGVDENGKSYPLFIWSFLAFKYPLYIYPTAIWTGLFGLGEATTRLQAALYGTATVPVAFVIARHFAGNGAGIAAALALAIMPWNFHFSRIAFSLIGLPFWFGLGFYFLAGALSPAAARRDWLLAGALLALTPYCYAPSVALMPPLLLLALALHADVVWRRRAWALAGIIAFLAVLSPFLYFTWHNLPLQRRYAELITVFRPGRSTADALSAVAANYADYFHPRFLFEKGDFIIRHRVKGFGQLYWAMAPWILAGAGTALLRRDRNSKLLLLWLALYPLGAALNREAQSATRSITGSLLFATLAGIGFGAVYAGAKRVFGRKTAIAASALAAAATTAFLVPSSVDYFRHYGSHFRTQAAFGVSGFQHGWRQVFAYTEPRRAEVDSVFLTRTEVNQPLIFARYYTDRTPAELGRWGPPERDYRLIYARTSAAWHHPGKSLLFVVRESDLNLFDSWQERHDILAPGGKLSFAILHNPVPKHFIRRWQRAGPFPNPKNSNRDTDFIDAAAASDPDRPSDSTAWTAQPNSQGYLDLNTSIGALLDPPTRNAEFQIVYLRTSMDSDRERDATIEINGSADALAVWLNGVLVQERRMISLTDSAHIPIRLRRGANTVVIKSIETVGYWWLAARVTD